jgi:hypothetical protein
MFKKEVDISDVEAILKGKDKYRVIWEDKEEIIPDESEKNENQANIWTEPLNQPNNIKNSVDNNTNNNQNHQTKSRHHPIHKHQHSIEFVVGSLAFFILVFFFFINSFLFWISLGILVVLFFIFYQFQKMKKAYVDKMQQNIVYLKIKNPILTGFEFALGIGLFGFLVLIVVLMLFGLVTYFATQGIISILSPYISF